METQSCKVTFLADSLTLFTQTGCQAYTNNKFTTLSKLFICPVDRFILRSTLLGAGDLAINKIAMVYNLREL